MHPAPVPGEVAGDHYMRQLDSLRAIAVIGVCLHHWTQSDVLGVLPLDSWRVQLFFALSGFLITMILMKARSRAESVGTTSWHALRAFYVRRILRTWPLFFVVLIAMALLNLHPSREEFAWNATFLTNIRIFLKGEEIGVVSHFWSLAVEEQFYLIWPWLILFTPRRALVWVLLGMAIVLNVSQVYLAWTYGSSRTGLGFLPGANVNTLVYGSILAIYKDHPGLDRFAKIAGLYIAAPIAIATFFLAKRKVFGPFSLTIDRIALAPLLGWILLQTARGVKGPIGKILDFGPLMWLGTISYGIYIIHNAPFTFLRDYQQTLHFNSIPKFNAILANEYTRVVLLGGITIALATISYYGFERPINRLKRFIPYAPRNDGPS